MTTIISFDETTAREIDALAENIGQTPDQYIAAYARDIHRAIEERGGIDAVEAENAARKDDGIQAEETKAPAE